MSKGSASPDGIPAGSTHDPILAAYEAATPEQQEAFADLFAGAYTDDQLAVSLQYLLGIEPLPREVRVFRLKVAQGRVTL